jgi:hypothetical protein
MSKQVTAALENLYGDHHLEAFCEHLRTQYAGESRQQFVAVIDHMGHHAHVNFPKKKHVIREAACAFVQQGKATRIKMPAALGTQEDNEVFEMEAAGTPFRVRQMRPG